MNIRIYVEEIQKKLEVFLKILTFEKNTVKYILIKFANLSKFN